MKYIELPQNCISRVVDICPLCNNTKTVSTPAQTVTLSIDPEYRTECWNCQVWWTTYRKNRILKGV